MKKTLSILFAIAASLNLWAADGRMTVTFSVTNPTIGKVAVVHNMKVDELTLDSNGKATWTYDGSDALYAKLYYGESLRNVYMERGDSLNLGFDGSDFERTATLTGGKERANQYLNQVRIVNLPDEDFKLSFAEYKAKAEKKVAQTTRLLNARKLTDQGQFATAEAGRIKYFYACSLLMYPVSHAFVAQDTTWKPTEEYYEALKQYYVEDEGLVEVAEYRDYMTACAHLFDKENAHERDFYRKIVAEMAYIGDTYQSNLLRQRFIHHLAFTWVEGFGVKGIEDMENVYYTYVTNPKLTAAYKEACEKWHLAAPGKPSPEINGTDIDGNRHTLADYRGKYIYIDMWATWCGPCQKELPYLKKLEETFRDKNILFLGLSIDEDKAKWEARVKSGALCGTQLHIGRGSKFQRDYGITGIPHFILLDPQGRIVNASMTRPSDESTADFLGKLLK